jgi:hypothetical protein
MSAGVVGAVTSRDNRPAYVKFEIRSEEDKAASEKEGRYVPKDVTYAIVTPCYSKDELHFKVDKWLAQMDEQVKNGRMPREWADAYKKAYKAFQDGQELPLEGVPIKGWPVISPSQQEMLIRMNIKTVEDLAGVNDEGARQIGMGAIQMKNKAIAWLSQARDKGPATMEIARLKTETEVQQSQIEKLSAQVDELKKLVKVQKSVKKERQQQEDDAE